MDIDSFRKRSYSTHDEIFESIKKSKLYKKHMGSDNDDEEDEDDYHVDEYEDDEHDDDDDEAGVDNRVFTEGSDNNYVNGGDDDGDSVSGVRDMFTVSEGQSSDSVDIYTHCKPNVCPCCAGLQANIVIPNYKHTPNQTDDEKEKQKRIQKVRDRLLRFNTAYVTCINMHAEEGTIIQIVNSLMFEWENLDLNELKFKFVPEIARNHIINEGRCISAVHRSTITSALLTATQKFISKGPSTITPKELVLLASELRAGQ